MAVDLTKQEQDIARQVAVSTLRRYRGYVEQRDIEHELLIWMWTHDEQVLKWRDQERTGSLRFVLVKEAQRYCEREKAARVGYAPSDNYGYSIGALRGLMEDALKVDLSEIDGVEPDAPYTQLLVDVRRGLKMISAKQAELLVQAARYGISSPGGADYAGLAEAYATEKSAPSDHAMRQRVDRALRALVDVLSRPRVEPAYDQEGYDPRAFQSIPRRSDANRIRQQLGEAA